MGRLGYLRLKLLPHRLSFAFHKRHEVPQKRQYLFGVGWASLPRQDRQHFVLVVSLELDSCTEKYSC